MFFKRVQQLHWYLIFQRLSFFFFLAEIDKIIENRSSIKGFDILLWKNN